MLGFKDLMSLVGEFLFRWSAMEQELSKAINLLEGGDFKQTNVRGELKERLDRWKRLQIKDANRPLVDEVISQIEELRSIRNLIVHGLAGVSALPANGAEAHINCMVGGWRAPTGDVKKITATELSHYIAAVDACLRGLGDPSRFNHRL